MSHAARHEGHEGWRCPGLLEAQELSQKQKLHTGHLPVLPMALKGKEDSAKHGKQRRQERYALGFS